MRNHNQYYPLNKIRTRQRDKRFQKKSHISKRDLALEESQTLTLLQNFSFPVSSSVIRQSQDGEYLFISGTYPPRIHCYEYSNLSLKFSRHLDAEISDFALLEDDFTKVGILRNDRYIELHAAFGRHHTVRVPHFGRSLCYNRRNCDLYISASKSSIFRLNLEKGSFMAPVQAPNRGINKIKFNYDLNILLSADEKGEISIFDSRNGHNSVGNLQVFEEEITALSLNEKNSLKFATGSSAGVVKLFDLRSQKYEKRKEHHHEFPILEIEFQNNDENKFIISADKKVVKIWDKKTGKNYANIEPKSDINSMSLIKQKGQTTGLIICASEQKDVNSFYVPGIGIAPKWAPFIENVVDEIEQGETLNKIEDKFENYKFVTREDLVQVELDNLIGTKMVKPYMHGFFIKTSLYQGAVALHKENDLEEELKKKKLSKKLQMQENERIKKKEKRSKKHKVRVNQGLLDQVELEEEAQKRKKKRVGLGKAAMEENERFKEMFEDSDFEVDEESEHYKKIYRESKQVANISKMKNILEEGDDEEIERVSQESEVESSDEGSESENGELKVLAKADLDSESESDLEEEQAILRNTVTREDEKGGIFNSSEQGFSYVPK
eukprot:snap_masked-scaffold_1-processed-gene-9.33-mRNA-1 protein AED:0.42 eAED:0.44 QI:0/-1/0/1/-1/1/1/0/608